MSYIGKCIETMLKNGKLLELRELHAILHKRVSEFTQQLTKAVIPDKDDIPLLTAAYKIIGDALYNTLEGRDKKLCDTIISNSDVVTVMREVNKDEV